MEWLWRKFGKGGGSDIEWESSTWWGRRKGSAGRVGFKEENSLQKRQLLSKKILEKYADRLPVVVVKLPVRGTPEIDKTKFLVPDSFTVQQTVAQIRNSFGSRLLYDQTLYFYVNKNVLLPLSSNMIEAYHRFKDEDGFLYIYYATEDTFG